jgi:hypothetical protein
MCGSRRRAGFGGCSRRNGAPFGGGYGPPKYSPVGMLMRHMSQKRDAKYGIQQQQYGFEPEKQSYVSDNTRVQQQSFGNEKYTQGQRGVPVQWVEENRGQRTQTLEEKEEADLAEAIRQSLAGTSTEQLPTYGQVMKQ